MFRCFQMHLSILVPIFKPTCVLFISVCRESIDLCIVVDSASGLSNSEWTDTLNLVNLITKGFEYVLCDLLSMISYINVL